MSFHEEMMLLALEEAKLAASIGEVPVGAVIVRNGQVVVAAHNQRELDHDPTAHAEILAIQQASKALGKRRLDDCTLYVTLEPCPMCAGAMVLANLGKCYFGAFDECQGCAGSVLHIPQEPAFYHHPLCVGGLLEEACASVLNEFFANRRTNP